MSRADPSIAALVLRRHGGLARELAAIHRLEHWLVAAVICQESAGDPHARRAEPRFLRDYQASIERSVIATRDRDARQRYVNWWRSCPLIFATSIGLMQVLLVTAIEHGMLLTLPEDLEVPAVGIEAGCRKLRACFNHTAGAAEPIRAALLAYNGGGNRAYPDEVIAWQDAIMAAAP